MTTVKIPVKGEGFKLGCGGGIITNWKTKGTGPGRGTGRGGGGGWGDSPGSSKGRGCNFITSQRNIIK